MVPLQRGSKAYSLFAACSGGCLCVCRNSLPYLVFHTV